MVRKIQRIGIKQCNEILKLTKKTMETKQLAFEYLNLIMAGVKGREFDFQ